MSLHSPSITIVAGTFFAATLMSHFFGPLPQPHMPLSLLQAAAKLGPHLGRVYRFLADLLAAKGKILYRLFAMKQHLLLRDYLQMRKRKCSPNQLGLCLDFLLLLDTLK